MTTSKISKTSKTTKVENNQNDELNTLIRVNSADFPETPVKTSNWPLLRVLRYLSVLLLVVAYLVIF